METPEKPKKISPEQAKKILLCLTRTDQALTLEPGIKVGSLGDRALKDIMLDAGGYAMTFSQGKGLALTRIRSPKGALFEGRLPIKSTLGIMEEARLRVILEEEEKPPRYEVQQRWVVTHDGVPVGGRLDRGVGKKGIGFPQEIYGNLKGFDSEDKAKKCLEKLLEYEADLKAKEAMRKTKKRR